MVSCQRLARRNGNVARLDYAFSDVCVEKDTFLEHKGGKNQTPLSIGDRENQLTLASLSMD